MNFHCPWQRCSTITSRRPARCLLTLFALVFVATRLDRAGGGSVATASGTAMESGWFVGDWRECKATGAAFSPDGLPVPPWCTGGLQRRSVTCSKSGLRCQGHAPMEMRFCVVGEYCGWVTSGWSGCSAAECGELGTQLRTVECIVSPEDWIGACPVLSAAASVTSQECMGSAGCDYFKTDWSSCSAACGAGSQSRVVKCADLSGCGLPRPAERRACEGSACSWSTGEWGSCSGSCGSDGVQKRSVTCEMPGRCVSNAPRSVKACRACARLASAQPSPTASPTSAQQPDSDSAPDTGNTEEDADDDEDYYVVPFEWFVGHWESCDVECGMGRKRREVYCQKTCSNFKCGEVENFRCRNLGLEEPLRTTMCSGFNGPFAGGGTGGACLADATEITGTMLLRINEAPTFFQDGRAKAVVRNVIFTLAGGGPGGAHDTLTLEMVTVTFRLGAGNRNRRLSDSALTVLYSLALPSNLGEAAVTEARNQLVSKTLEQVFNELHSQLQQVEGVDQYIVAVDDFTINDPGLAATPPPSTAPAVPTPSVAPLNPRKTMLTPPPTPPRLAQQAAPLAPLEEAHHSAPSDGDVGGDDGADAANLSSVVALGAIAVFVLVGIMCCCCFAVYCYSRTPNKTESPSSSFDKLKVQSTSSTPTVTATFVGSTPASRGGSFAEDSNKPSAEQPPDEDVPNFRATWHAGFKPGKSADLEHGFDDGFELPPELQSTSPKSEQKKKGGTTPESNANGGADVRRSKAEDGDSTPGMSPSTPSKSQPRRSKTEGANLRSSRSDAADAKKTFFEDFGKDIGKEFHERRADAKSKSASKQPKRAGTTQTERKSSDAGSTKPNSPPRGTATPPRSTEKSSETGANDFGKSPGDATTTSEEPRSPAGEDARAGAGPLPPGSSPDAEEEATAAAAKEVIAQLDVELDQTLAKDLEWRRRHFKGLLLKWHPDKNRHQSQKATEVFKHLMKRRAGYLDT